MKRHIAFLSVILVCGVMVGCTQSPTTAEVDPAVVQAHRTRLVLDEEPDGAVGVIDVREMLAGPTVEQSDESPGDENSVDASVTPASLTTGPPTESAEVIVVGKIGGVPNPWKDAQPDYPWTKNQAKFVLADAAAAAEVEAHGSHHHDDPDHECPFCASAADSDAVAVIRFFDESGKVISIDARKLFEVKEDATVVVKGTARLVGSKEGLLMIDADGIYVRR